jgi:hypothetical protein
MGVGEFYFIKFYVTETSKDCCNTQIFGISSVEALVDNMN